MWLMSFIPVSMLEVIIYGIFTIGIISTIISLLLVDTMAKIIPGIFGYSKITQIVSICILSVGIYLHGSYSTEMGWRQQVSILEQQLKIAEEKSVIVNSNLEKNVVNNAKATKQRTKKIIKYIDREIIKYNNQCVIPDEAITVLNDAASMGQLHSEENSK